jgi:hypothetical protein
VTKKELIAWAAGFWEGEGTICCTANNWSIQLKNCDTQMLERFMTVVGTGKIYAEKRVVGKPIFVWQTGRSDDIYRITGLFWKYLSDRRQDQIIDVILKRETYLQGRSVWGASRADAISKGRGQNKINWQDRDEVLAYRAAYMRDRRKKMKELHVRGIR